MLQCSCQAYLEYLRNMCQVRFPQDLASRLAIRRSRSRHPHLRCTLSTTPQRPHHTAVLLSLPAPSRVCISLFLVASPQPRCRLAKFLVLRARGMNPKEHLATSVNSPPFALSSHLLVRMSLRFGFPAGGPSTCGMGWFFVAAA